MIHNHGTHHARRVHFPYYQLAYIIEHRCSSQIKTQITRWTQEVPILLGTTPYRIIVVVLSLSYRATSGALLCVHRVGGRSTPPSFSIKHDVPCPLLTNSARQGLPRSCIAVDCSVDVAVATVVGALTPPPPPPPRLLGRSILEGFR